MGNSNNKQKNDELLDSETIKKNIINVLYNKNKNNFGSEVETLGWFESPKLGGAGKRNRYDELNPELLINQLKSEIYNTGGSLGLPSMKKISVLGTSGAIGTSSVNVNQDVPDKTEGGDNYKAISEDILTLLNQQINGQTGGCGCDVDKNIADQKPVVYKNVVNNQSGGAVYSATSPQPVNYYSGRDKEYSNLVKSVTSPIDYTVLRNDNFNLGNSTVKNGNSGANANIFVSQNKKGGVNNDPDSQNDIPSGRTVGLRNGKTNKNISSGTSLFNNNKYNNKVEKDYLKGGTVFSPTSPLVDGDDDDNDYDKGDKDDDDRDKDDDEIDKDDDERDKDRGDDNWDPDQEGGRRKKNSSKNKTKQARTRDSQDQYQNTKSPSVTSYNADNIIKPFYSTDSEYFNTKRRIRYN